MPDYTVKQFCRQVNLSERAVRQHIRDGRIPSYKIGCNIRIPAEAVDAIRDGALNISGSSSAEPPPASAKSERPTFTVAQGLELIEEIDAGGAR